MQDSTKGHFKKMYIYAIVQKHIQWLMFFCGQNMQIISEIKSQNQKKTKKSSGSKYCMVEIK